MGLIIGGSSASDLILDGSSVSLYEGGNPPIKVWPTVKEVVQITLGSGTQAQSQFRAALTERGLDYGTITEVPFDIELVGSGATQYMFSGCRALTHAPEMDTSKVNNMSRMFMYCSALVSVPDMSTSNVTNTTYMFAYTGSLRDGNVRLIGKHRSVSTTSMILSSGLTRMPFYNASGSPI